MAIDVIDLPSAAARLADLSPREREILGLLAEGLASREIAERLAVSEGMVYHVVADLLDAVEFGPVALSAGEIHRRAGTRPATTEELAAFDAEFGPFDADSEG
jgi:DNA-binding CsgD family transcriptional regulator